MTHYIQLTTTELAKPVTYRFFFDPPSQKHVAIGLAKAKIRAVERKGGGFIRLEEWSEEAGERTCVSVASLIDLEVAPPMLIRWEGVA